MRKKSRLPEPDVIHLRYEDMTPEERGWRFEFFTPEQLEASIRAWGLPDRCTDPDTLRAAAEIEVAAIAARRAARDEAGGAR